MKSHTSILAILVGLPLIATAVARSESATPAVEPVAIDATAPAVVEPPPAPLPFQTTHTISKGEVLGTIMPTYGVDTERVRAAALEWHDLSRLRADAALIFSYDGVDPLPIGLRYALDADRTLVLTRGAPDPTGRQTWSGQLDEIVYEHRLGRHAMVIKDTLWEAARAAGLSPADINSLAEVYQYDVDFNTELRAGAILTVVADELWTEGRLARLGTPMAARLVNAGETLVAVRYAASDGKSRFYDGEGTVRRKAFLRSPLAFSRVTSGFSHQRYHPILKRARPHLGVDFGAPTGTPVRAVGDGVVEVAGTQGGHGRFVKIDHPGPYASSYSHLSSIAVRPGARVQQGDLIGAVGSTGLATGPHLHFQFWVGAKHVNPLSIEMPTQEQLQGADLTGFRAERDRLIAILDDQQEGLDSGEPGLADADEGELSSDAAEDAAPSQANPG
jgi:murein DD-endopeptidase MepM/ murein hydrolase activator NlpD